MARPSQPRRSARIAGRKPIPRDSPDPPPSPQAQRQRPQASRNSKVNQDKNNSNNHDDRCDRKAVRDRPQTRSRSTEDSIQVLSSPPEMPPPPPPQVPKHLQTPESAQPRRQVNLGVSPLYPHRPSKRRVNDSAELPPAKRARPNVQQPGLTPLTFHNQTIVSPDGEVLLSPITARRNSARPSILTNTSPGAGPSPGGLKSPEEFRREAATFHLSAPGPKGQSATVAKQFRFPEHRPIVPQTAKMMRIETWLKQVETDDKQDNPPPQTLPMSPLSLSTNRSFGAGVSQPRKEEPASQPTKEQLTSSQNVPVTKPAVVDLTSLSSSYEEYSYSSYSDRAASKKNETEYESAQELIQTHDRAQTEANSGSPGSKQQQPVSAVRGAARAFEIFKTLIYKSKEDHHQQHHQHHHHHETGTTGVAVHPADADRLNGI